MDEKDKHIIDTLTEDGSLTTREISKKTGVPITTVHKRIKKLKEQGIIKRFTIELDYKQLGKGFPVLILVCCDYKLLRELKKDQHKLAKEIQTLPEVECVDIVTGEIDLVVRIRVKDVEEFDAFLLKRFQKIAGIDRTKSLVVIHET